MIYKAVVKDKRDHQVMIIERDYPNKAEFIEDLRGNGFMVNPVKVKEARIFDHIMDHTNCELRDWKRNGGLK